MLNGLMRHQGSETSSLVRHFLDQWNHGWRRLVKWAAVAEAIKSFKNPFLWCVISSFVSTVWVLRIQPATPCGPETLVLPRCFQCDAVWIFCCWTFPLRVPVSAASSINATTWQWEGFAPRFLNQSPSVAADCMAAPQGQEPEPCISTQPVTLEERQHRYLDSSCLYHGQASHLISHKPNLTSSIGIIGSIGMSSQWTVPQEAPFLSHPLTGGSHTLAAFMGPRAEDMDRVLLPLPVPISTLGSHHPSDETQTDAPLQELEFHDFQEGSGSGSGSATTLFFTDCTKPLTARGDEIGAGQMVQILWQ